jgi:hypothetical protein
MLLWLDDVYGYCLKQFITFWLINGYKQLASSTDTCIGE